jgi:hypothetical protein
VADEGTQTPYGTIRPLSGRPVDPDFGVTYRRHRPMVERSITWVTPATDAFPTVA